jgi:hypothetical protein
LSVNIPSSSSLFPSSSSSLSFSGFEPVSSLSGAAESATPDAELFTEAGLTRHLGVGRDDWFLALLKELLDDAIDACEISGVSSPDIGVKITHTTLAIAYNGHSLLKAPLSEYVLSSAESISESPYLSLSRGQKGNTLKSLLAAGLLVDGDSSCVHVESCGQRHVIEVRHRTNTDGPVLNHAVQESDVITGVKITFFYPSSARSLLYTGQNDLSPAGKLIDNFAAFNPHVRIVLFEPPLDWIISFGAKSSCSKWSPHDRPSPHWYSNEQFRQLVADVAHHQKWMSVAGFVSKFRGLSGTTPKDNVMDMARLEDEMPLSDLCVDTAVNRVNLERLLMAMKTEGELVTPQQLGILGKEHLDDWLGNFAGVLSDSYDYFCIQGFDTTNLPYVLEVGFARLSSGPRIITTGTNFTCNVENPIPELEDMLNLCGISEFASVALLVHFACPRVDFVDRGKTRGTLPADVLLRLKGGLTLIAQQCRIDATEAVE